MFINNYECYNKYKIADFCNIFSLRMTVVDIKSKRYKELILYVFLYMILQRTTGYSRVQIFVKFISLPIP